MQFSLMADAEKIKLSFAARMIQSFAHDDCTSFRACFEFAILRYKTH